MSTVQFRVLQDCHVKFQSHHGVAALCNSGFAAFMLAWLETCNIHRVFVSDATLSTNRLMLVFSYANCKPEWVRLAVVSGRGDCSCAFNVQAYALQLFLLLIPLAGLQPLQPSIR